MMKRMATSGCITGVCLLVGLLFAADAVAQGTPPSSNVLRIRRLEGESVKAPQYQVTQGTRTVRQRNWLQVKTEYETAPDWIDEMTFTYYVLLRNARPKQGEQEFNLFKGEVTYINIAKTRTGQSTVFMHPSSVERYGSLERVGLVVSSQGRILAMESKPSSQERWWERATPRTGYILNRSQTPFSMLNVDDFEAIKPAD